MYYVLVILEQEVLDRKNLIKTNFYVGLRKPKVVLKAGSF